MLTDSPPTTRVTSPAARALALVVYAAALGVWIRVIGVPTDAVQIFLWLWLGTIAWDVRAPARQHLRFVRDWWPPLVLLLAYLYARGFADELVAIPVHVTEPIDFDRWISGGTIPTRRLQDALCDSPCVGGAGPRWYDLGLTTVYFTHFVAGLGLAVVLWMRNRAEWVRWMRRYLTINVSALVVYVVYPMAPPWLASEGGYLPGEEVARLTGRGWSDVGMGGFHLALANVGNPVAAMPSLHTGISALIAMYAVVRLRTRWRWLALLYPLAMSFALVYFGEHYVIDIIAGWLLAALVLVGCRWWERRHEDASVDDTAGRVTTG